MTTENAPHIRVAAPFPNLELPALFCWSERIKASIWDDTIPNTLDEWMDTMLDRLASPNVLTFGLYKDDRLGGYFEAVASMGSDGREIEDALKYIAQAQVIFKKEFWGLRYTRPAVNLALAEVFKTGIETVFFPVFAHNRPLRELFWKVGARALGSINPRLQNGSPIETEMYALTATEWRKENAAVETPEAQHEDALEKRLVELGYLEEIREPIRDFTPYENRTLIKVEGKPLSEIIVEDRR